MRRLGTFWLVCALALVTAVFAASAFAGGGQGHDSNGGGQESGQQQGGGDQHGWSRGQDQSSHQSSDQKQSDRSSSNEPGNGVKPSSTTFHGTTTKVGDQPDISKRYGNGKTAAEIAKSHGAPDGTTVLVGPGNSQPHKVVSCKHPHGVDVHAVKSYSTDECKAAKVEEQKPAEQLEIETSKPAEAKALGVDHKVTLCHLTGNGTYVAITVDKHSLEEGHTAAKGDIVPMPAGGCGAVAAVQTELGKTCLSGEAKGDDDENGDEHSGQRADFQGEHHDNQGPEISEDNDADEANECATESTGTAAASVQSPTISAQASAVVTPTVSQAASATVTNSATPPSATVVASNAQSGTPAQGGVLGATADLGTPRTAGGGVLGATSNLAAPKTANGGVLGAVGNIAGASLPFTGFPVWPALLVALALVGLGLVLRRGGGTANRL